MLGETEGLLEIFPRAQPCSLLVIGSMIQLHAIVECGSAFFKDISKGMQILVNYPILLTRLLARRPSSRPKDGQFSELGDFRQPVLGGHLRTSVLNVTKQCL